MNASTLPSSPFRSSSGKPHTQTEPARGVPGRRVDSPGVEIVLPSTLIDDVRGVSSPPPPLTTPHTETQARRTPLAHPRRILVADDESLAGAAVMQALRQLGYEAVGPARDGEHAVLLAFSTMPDMAVLDVRMMTDSDGIDAARALFHEMLLPVVIVSAFSDQQQVAAATEAGVFGYLVKPVTREQLRPAIEVAWARFNQYLEKEIEAEVLRRKLEDRMLIEQAKWFLVERDSLIESEAMRLLRHLAKEARCEVAAMARSLLGR